MPPLPGNGEVLDGAKLKKLVENDEAFKKYIDAEFDELDENKNGKLSVTELKPAILKVASMLGLPPPGTREEADTLVDSVFQELYAKDLSEEIDRETFATHSREVLAGIADGLQEDPFVVAILDGSIIKELVNDKEAFSKVAGSLFDELDADKSGRLDRSELKTAVHMLGLEKGLPAQGKAGALDTKVSQLMEKYGHGQDSLDKAEFQELMASILTDLGADLDKDPVYIVHDYKVLNGAPMRKMLSSEEAFKEVVSKMFDDWDSSKDGKLQKSEVAEGFKVLGLAFGLPPPESKEESEKLFAQVFDAADYDHNGYVDKNEFAALIKGLFEAVADEMEANPVIIDTTIIAR